MKYFKLTIITMSLAVAIVLLSIEPASAQTRKRVVVFLVEGYADCCIYKAKTLIDWFQSLNSADIEIVFAGIDARKIQSPKSYYNYTIPWNSLYNHGQGTDVLENVTSGTDNFVTEVTEYVNSLPVGTGLVFIGHSFGGDSILSFLTRYHRTAHPILFAGVIDPVDGGGIRNSLRSKTVSDNVKYFFNRWQTNEPWPVDFLTSGSISCNADNCNDQKKQNVQRNRDGSAKRVRCGDLEIGCQGAEWKWEDCGILCGYWKWYPGTRNERVSHKSLASDAYVQQQMINKLNRLVREFAASPVFGSTQTPETTRESDRETPYGLVCLVNRTNWDINYKFRWGEAEWKSLKVLANRTRSHWWNYAPGSHVSPNFKISFDADFTDGANYKQYDLKRYRAAGTDCWDGKVYEFKKVATNTIELYDSGK